MGLFNSNKKFRKNVTRDNEFLKDYATKTHGLLLYADDNDKVKAELNALKDDFQYTTASPDAAAKGLEKKIKKEFEALAAMLAQPAWDEASVLLAIKDIRRTIVEISSMV